VRTGDVVGLGCADAEAWAASAAWALAAWRLRPGAVEAEEFREWWRAGRFRHAIGDEGEGFARGRMCSGVSAYFNVEGEAKGKVAVR